MDRQYQCRERTIRMARGLLRVASLWVASLLLVAPVIADSKPDYADRVAGFLQQNRQKNGQAALPRDPRLDEVALKYAKQLARLPAKRRHSAGTTMDPLLKQAGFERYRNARTYMDFQKGFNDPVGQFAKNWEKYPQSFQRWVGAAPDPFGLVVYRANDGWLMLVAVIVEGADVEYDDRQIARDIAREVNQERMDRGLGALEWNTKLAKIARAHSEDMAKRDYFDHVSPSGKDAADRVSERGMIFRRVGENLFLCRGYEDPVRRSVEGWMESPGHRKNILNGEFEQSGIGVHVTRDGTLYITQIFFTEPQ